MAGKEAEEINKLLPQENMENFECGKNKETQICDKISQEDRTFSESVYFEQLVFIDRFT